tara:strand:+ start:3134 stop:4447 length:1314 start_codon:yes stop_codon:yes gene_type:complete
MTHPQFKVQSLDEDMAALGIDGEETMRLALTEGMYSEDTLAEDEDPIDGKLVTRDLLLRIANLPLAEIEVEKVQAVFDGLMEKELPEGDEDIENDTKRVVESLRARLDEDDEDEDDEDEDKKKCSCEGEEHIEGCKLAEGADEDDLLDEAKKFKVKRRRQAGVAKRGPRKKHATKGNRMVGGRAVKAERAAGGKSKLNREKRLLKRWRRTGPGQKSRKKSVRVAKRYSKESVANDLFSPITEEDGGMVIEDRILCQLYRCFEHIDLVLFDDDVHDGLNEVWDAFNKDIDDKVSFEEAIKESLAIIGRSLDIIQEGGGLMDYTDAVEGGDFDLVPSGYRHPDDPGLDGRGGPSTFSEDDAGLGPDGAGDPGGTEISEEVWAAWAEAGVSKLGRRAAIAAMETALIEAGYDVSEATDTWYDEALTQLEEREGNPEGGAE